MSRVRPPLWGTLCLGGAGQPAHGRRSRVEPSGHCDPFDAGSRADGGKPGAQAYPTDPGVKSQAVVVMAVLAAAIGSFSNLSYPAYVHEKGWRSKEAAARQKLDLRVSIFLLFLDAGVGAGGRGGCAGVARTEGGESGGPDGHLHRSAWCSRADPVWCRALTYRVQLLVSNGAGQGIMLADIYHRLIGRVTDPRESEVYMELRPTVGRSSSCSALQFTYSSPDGLRWGWCWSMVW